MNLGGDIIPRAIINATEHDVLAVLRKSYAAKVAERGMTIDVVPARSTTLQAAKWLTQGSKSLPWLMLSGNVGTGKTTLIGSILDTLMHFGVEAKKFPASDFPVLFLGNDEITEQQILRGDFCEVLLLDDVGADTSDVKFYGNVIQPFVRIVEERYNRRLPLILTTNLSAEGMQERYGIRTLDRILEMAAVIRYDGQSYRRTNKQ